MDLLHRSADLGKNLCFRNFGFGEDANSTRTDREVRGETEKKRENKRGGERARTETGSNHGDLEERERTEASSSVLWDSEFERGRPSWRSRKKETCCCPKERTASSGGRPGPAFLEHDKEEG